MGGEVIRWILFLRIYTVPAVWDSIFSERPRILRWLRKGDVQDLGHSHLPLAQPAVDGIFSERPRALRWLRRCDVQDLGHSHLLGAASSVTRVSWRSEAACVRQTA